MAQADPPREPSRTETIARQFIEAIPHAQALGMAISEIGAGRAVIEMPWDARLVGDPATGVIHGGAVSTLIDTASGAAVMAHERGPASTATLDLRIDYMRGAAPGEGLTAAAECYHITRTVAFVRAEARQGDRLIAAASGAFTVQGVS
ncbi:PaaI family thioesterase [Histidinibacterium aquaticum]|uniref:PaaI family thioesterase n=1 Tax=Histidinibacterium aquaticum TaxID=2613962 RepID=A0A5J5GJP5_9RHOB|nr:PaaI family thioesterase [Histidinibacterium aquaticum]KAA9008290.1 PaaI family thioesterase [Histidinibacterium aquaticum]